MRSLKQQAKILKEVARRYPREVTVAMSRAEFKALCDSIAKEIFN